MKRPPLLLAVFAAAAWLAAAPPNAQASGAYCVCLPKPPVHENATVDRDKFDLGQKVFNGRTAPASGDAAVQTERLDTLQDQLPENITKKRDLRKLAGKLTPAQLDALEYYVHHRYPKHP